VLVYRVRTNCTWPGTLCSGGLISNPAMSLTVRDPLSGPTGAENDQLVPGTHVLAFPVKRLAPGGKMING
jgi:hypothetical protein